MAKKCEICGKDISHLHGNTRFCERHQDQAAKNRKSRNHNNLTPDARQNRLEQMRENTRKLREDPDYRDKEKKEAADRFQKKKKKDPKWYEERLNKNRVTEA